MEITAQQLQMDMKGRINLIELIINGIYVNAVRDGIYAIKIASYNKYITEYMLQEF